MTVCNRVTRKLFAIAYGVALCALPVISTSVYAEINWSAECAQKKMYDPVTGTYTWNGTRGRYFCVQEEPKKEPKRKRITANAKKKNKPKDCSNPKQWDSTCGFVNPDDLPPQEAFKFQAKQRDVLLQNMSVRPESMETVMAAQKYINWVVDKAMLLSNMYEYTAVQNPELDPNAEYTSSSFGQKLIAAQNLDNRRLFWRTLNSWGGEIVIFTRASCPFCEAQGETLNSFLFEHKVKLVEVALEEQCVLDLADECIKGDPAKQSAKQFSVRTVPTTLVFVPNQDGKTPADGLWLRISNGFSTGSTIRNRLFSYLNAWYAAAAKGVENAIRQPDFNGTRALNRREMKKHLNQVIGVQPKGDKK